MHFSLTLIGAYAPIAKGSRNDWPPVSGMRAMQKQPSPTLDRTACNCLDTGRRLAGGVNAQCLLWAKIGHLLLDCRAIEYMPQACRGRLIVNCWTAATVR